MMKHNIFAKWWFTLLVVPAILFLFGFIRKESDEVIFGWLTIMVIAFGYQIFVNIRYKIKDSSLYFLYILLVINFMMFFGYILGEYSGIYEALDEHMPWVVAKLINAIIIGLISYVAKLVIWLLLSWRWRKTNKVKHQKSQLEKEVAKLMQENKELRIKNNQMAQRNQDLSNKTNNLKNK